MSFQGGVALIAATDFRILKLDDAVDIDRHIFLDSSRASFTYYNHAYNTAYVTYEPYTIPFDEYIKIQNDTSYDDTFCLIYGY